MKINNKIYEFIIQLNINYIILIKTVYSKNLMLKYKI